MSIESAFDNKSVPLITPEKMMGRTGNFGTTCISTFSGTVLEKVLSEYETTVVSYTGTANGKIPIYRLEKYNVLFYMSPIGSCVAGAALDEVHVLTGASAFIFFGTAGILDEEKCRGKIIVPEEAYRDEGFSYHFAPPADYIKITNAPKLESVFSQLSIPFVKGKTWSTDAIYMETKSKAEKRKSEGCLCVDMECSGLQALCNFRRLELYQFMFGADVLSESSWSRSGLGGECEKKNQTSAFDLALKISGFLGAACSH